MQYDKPNDEEKTVRINFNLPLEIKDELSALLDLPIEGERDWRGLTKKLHFDRYPQVYNLHFKISINLISVFCFISWLFSDHFDSGFMGSVPGEQSASCARSPADPSSYGQTGLCLPSRGIPFVLYRKKAIHF